MPQPTYAITANSLTAETFRQAPASHISGTGVVGAGDLAVAQNGTPNMSVNVAAGQVWVPGTLSSTTGFPTNLNAQTTWGLPSSLNEQGSYYQWYSGTTNLAISAADPTNPRIDLAVVSIQDAQYSGSNNQGILQIITGTPAASPSPPSAPASSVVLAQIAVAAGAGSIVTGNITDKRPFMAVRGGIQPACRVHRAGALTLTTGANTQLVFDTVDVDNFSGYATGTGLYTVPSAGVYAVSGMYKVNTGSTADFFSIFVNHNGVTTGNDGSFGGNGTNAGTAVSYDVVKCNAGDTLGILYGTNAAAGVTNATMTVAKVSN